MSNSIIFSKDNLPNVNDNIDNKDIYVKTSNNKLKKVIRNQNEINELMNKLYYKKCNEFDRLSSYAYNNDYLEDIKDNYYEKGMDRVFDRLGVKHSNENLLLVTEFLLFNECSKQFDSM